MNEEDLYTKLYDYFAEMFPLDANNIVRGLQNQSPMPQNAIVITLIYAQDLDQSQYWNAEDESTVQGSKQQMVQVDFYGDDAYNKSMKCYTLWRSVYTTDRLEGMQPLFANTPRNFEFVNEEMQYEKRFMLEIALQYNAYYTYAEDSILVVSNPNITPIP